MTKIKICGITNLSDALAAVELGADALGFVFYFRSPRAISPAKAEQIRRSVPPYTFCVGVFVNEEEDEVLRIADRCQLDALQFHGRESPAYCSDFSHYYKVIKAFSPQTRSDLDEIGAYQVAGVVIDAPDVTRFGGTGNRCDWDLARTARTYGPVILAGGLNEDNVQDAIRAVNPYGVDVSSGVEAKPGRKDHEKIKRFITQVRKADFIRLTERRETEHVVKFA